MTRREESQKSLFPPLAMETPVLVVPSSMRVVQRDDLPAGVAYFIDGETFQVNGEYPYSAKGAK